MYICVYVVRIPVYIFFCKGMRVRRHEIEPRHLSAYTYRLVPHFFWRCDNIVIIFYNIICTNNFCVCTLLCICTRAIWRSLKYMNPTCFTLRILIQRFRPFSSHSSQEQGPSSERMRPRSVMWNPNLKHSARLYGGLGIYMQQVRQNGAIQCGLIHTYMYTYLYIFDIRRILLSKFNVYYA